MTILPPEPGEPRRPHGPRDPGDAWVQAPSGERYWGRFGAAGLLALDPVRGVLLQHRVGWSHFGGTWALPGGARHEGEDAAAGAIREAREEAGVPHAAVRSRFESVFDVGVWSYTTVVADVVEPFTPVISDPESLELAWVAIDRVAAMPLHPGFAASWPALRALLSTHPAVVVDMANVVGSVPDGWWRDRAGAASRLLARLSHLAMRGLPASDLGLGGDVWFPRWIAVVEGQARAAATDATGVEIVAAPGEGDDTIVSVAADLRSRGHEVVVVTSDRGLTQRVSELGGRVQGSRWLRGLLDSA
ncbi:NUDIX domain-containing protein [Microbacterium xanthum]|uniref:NUDIX domain-containing protein n=1 Tax=Microbacterium xanthum TaxID=3079794 RepID=UPI002AD36EF2|nr:NUDIX domain-containing protein [Microbacterium sp. KSW-48]MDZ8172468.1 NUDIX domain-containing protein [Microbacterium sp. KSW-48]